MAELLLPHLPDGPPRGVVLMLHGGAPQSSTPVDDRSLLLRRARSTFTSLTPRLAGAGYAAHLLRCGVNGWNEGGGGPAPVADARRALDELGRRRVVAAHGRRHTITSARQTRAYLQRANPTAASVDFVDMGAGGHDMLTRVRRWNAVALESTLAVLGDA